LGWFWTYAFEYHQQHDTNPDRFWRSFSLILGKYPVMTTLVAVGLAALVTALALRRRLPSGGTAFLYWVWMFACACVIGAVGWATQWAHFNAFIPAIAIGAIAAGAALPVIAASIDEIFPNPRWIGTLATTACVAALGFQLYQARWSPRMFVPAEADRAAGDRLIARLKKIDGPVFVPFHPFYAHLAGKPTHAHRMGMLDVTYTPPSSEGKKQLRQGAHQVSGLSERLRAGYFSAIVLDDRAHLHELPGITQGYEQAEVLSAHEAPRTFSGAPTVPRAVWLPKKKRK
ncbi:MAG: hypothetical protein V2A73_10430, partial [Pseudomonadota bacterium]